MREREKKQKERMMQETESNEEGRKSSGKSKDVVAYRPNGSSASLICTFFCDQLPCLMSNVYLMAFSGATVVKSGGGLCTSVALGPGPSNDAKTFFNDDEKKAICTFLINNVHSFKDDHNDASMFKTLPFKKGQAKGKKGAGA